MHFQVGCYANPIHRDVYFVASDLRQKMTLTELHHNCIFISILPQNRGRGADLVFVIIYSHILIGDRRAGLVLIQSIVGRAHRKRGGGQGST